MLVTASMQAEVYVDRAILCCVGADEAVRQQLARAVIAEADKSAWKVRSESVHIRRIDNPDDQRGVRFVGIWSPRSARLVGGEYDGDAVDGLHRDDATGLPLDVLHLPYRDGAALDRTASGPPPLVRNPAYRRAGTDPITDVWVYTLIG